jgi:cellobiose phosphorylase
LYKEILARGYKDDAKNCLRIYFRNILTKDSAINAVFLDKTNKIVFGVDNLEFEAPVIMELFKDHKIYKYILNSSDNKKSILLSYLKKEVKIYTFLNNKVEEIAIDKNIKSKLIKILKSVSDWPGILNQKGEHIIDLKSPNIAPHYSVNLLIGERIGFDNPLQTTPKSVVDMLGRGSSRSHADTQVLATRWDMRQEENGFPANRQFYIYEDEKQLFYSANPKEKNIVQAKCKHSQNYTVINYKTECGLDIERVIFILNQKENLPIATEVQEIKIVNKSNCNKNLKFIYTGMFGSSVPLTLYQDVLYSNIVMQSKIVKKSTSNEILAIGSDYSQNICKDDLRFHTSVLKQKNDIILPSEFCTDYNEFVGSGSLYNPEGVYFMNSSIKRTGPGFFAVALYLNLEPDEEVIIDNFTGLVSLKLGKRKKNKMDYIKEISNLIEFYKEKNSIKNALNENIEFYEKYKSFVQIVSDSELFDTYFNNNLPFQVLYQTFVSRSFCQTQKGYREIGFREIQDLFSSMYYFIGMGYNKLVRNLLMEWASKIFEMGYVYHNFYWEGKEPGKASDDQIWFVLAVCRYINITGEIDFLDEKCKVAKTKPQKYRTIYNSIKSIIRYSGEISIGKHGLPLLDYFDWNECLKIDTDSINGVTKERNYKRQIKENNHVFGDRFESNYSESVMNAFLLKSAIDEIMYLSEERGDMGYNKYLINLSNKLYNNIQDYAWKSNFFARVLFNNKLNKEKYLGAKNDGFSSTALNGTYFLNSFTWSIFSNVANEEQIYLMINEIERTLKTENGLKLLSNADLSSISDDMPDSLYFHGDRENGGILKHACMMAVKAMFKSANEVKSREIAKKLIELAYWMLDLVLPYKTIKNPFVLKGNPRFCTKYINSDTGESIGPLISGASTWFTLALFASIGFDINRNSIVVNPILKENSESLKLIIKIYKDKYIINFYKSKGFKRILDDNFKVLVDGNEYFCNAIPIFCDGKVHTIDLKFE